jgi:hypothetical protein
MYTWPNSQGMLYTLGVLRPRSSITGRRKLAICLGGSLTHLTLCLATNLLSRQYVVWTYGRRATEVGLSVGLEVLTAGLSAQLICLILQSFSLEVVLRNSTHHGGFPCHTEAWLCVTKLKVRPGRWTDGGVIQSVGRRLCGLV